MGSAQALPSIPAGATHVLIQAETNDIRWRDDGTNPSTTVGMVITAGTDLWYVGNLRALKIIEVGTDSIANISYYK